MRAPVAVILDFDGVIADSLEAHLEAWRRATAEVFRMPLESAEQFAGLGTRTIAGIISKRYGDSSLAKTLVSAKWRYLEEGVVPMTTFPGVHDFVAHLRGKRIPCGVASNSPRRFVAAAIQRFGIELDALVCGDEVALVKPNPDIFWECSNRLNVAYGMRAATVVYEDSVHGIKAALAAGMRAVGVTSAVTTAELKKAGAYATCRDLGEALSLGLLENLDIWGQT